MDPKLPFPPQRQNTSSRFSGSVSRFHDPRERTFNRMKPRSSTAAYKGAMQILKTLFVGSLVMLAWSGAAFAQTGTIQGTVTDATGALVQGAEVTVRSLESNSPHVVTSSSVGGYSVPDLPSGSYEISVKKEGFRVFLVPTAPLTVAQVLTINAELEPGTVNEEVQ